MTRQSDIMLHNKFNNEYNSIFHCFSPLQRPQKTQEGFQNDFAAWSRQ